MDDRPRRIVIQGKSVPPGRVNRSNSKIERDARQATTARGYPWRSRGSLALAVEGRSMHYHWCIRHIALGGLLLFASGSLRSEVTDADADRGSPDPVEELKQTLRIAVEDARPNSADLKARETALAQRIKALRSVRDLQRALNLSDWLDEGFEPLVAKIDQQARDEVVKRLVTDLRAYMERPDTQLAAANVISDLGTTIRETAGLSTPRKGITRLFAPDLARLIQTGSPAVREAAGRALSNIDPAPQVAAPALGNLLTADQVVLRRTGATGLRDLIQKDIQLIPGKGRSVTGVQSSWGEVLQTAAAVVPKAAEGLADADVEVRKACTEAIQVAAYALYDYLFEPIKRERTPTEIRDTLQPGVPARPADVGRRDSENE